MRRLSTPKETPFVVRDESCDACQVTELLGTAPEPYTLFPSSSASSYIPDVRSGKARAVCGPLIDGAAADVGGRLLAR
jgi:hypothetical protein